MNYMTYCWTQSGLDSCQKVGAVIAHLLARELNMRFSQFSQHRDSLFLPAEEQKLFSQLGVPRGGRWWHLPWDKAACIKLCLVKWKISQSVLLGTGGGGGEGEKLQAVNAWPNADILIWDYYLKMWNEWYIFCYKTFWAFYARNAQNCPVVTSTRLYS